MTLLDKKETFVGTPLYVAPEMLTDCKALPASDLWALGAIIYKMHTGAVPFQSPNQSNVFMKILSLEYEWPQNIAVSDETKDLVERLLKLNPQERLGADKLCSPNDLNLLMKHPYFKDICWESLEDSVVPLQLPKQIAADFEIVDYDDLDQQIVKEGILQKRNIWFWKQERHFILHRNGLLSYYSDGNSKGMIVLNK